MSRNLYLTFNSFRHDDAYMHQRIILIKVGWEIDGSYPVWCQAVTWTDGDFVFAGPLRRKLQWNLVQNKFYIIYEDNCLIYHSLNSLVTTKIVPARNIRLYGFCFWCSHTHTQKKNDWENCFSNPGIRASFHDPTRIPVIIFYNVSRPLDRLYKCFHCLKFIWRFLQLCCQQKISPIRCAFVLRHMRERKISGFPFTDMD